MNDEHRQRLKRMTEAARGVLEREFSEQLEGMFGIHPERTPDEKPGEHLTPRQRLVWRKLMDAISHQMQMDENWSEAVDSYVREAAFTFLNRFVALKMLEARGLVQECVTRGMESSGFREFTGLAPALSQDVDRAYRLYIESLFDEIGREVGILLDRRDPHSLLWPRRPTLLKLLELLNTRDLATVWALDETIGWMYQYFNSDAERREMRESPAPRNSRELAVRNQFYTPRYVVEFLTDNTLGRLWYEMMRGKTELAGLDFLVRWEREVFLEPGEPLPEHDAGEETEAVRYVLHRPKKDPRDLAILDPACGSGHFLLYAFDILMVIYKEAWQDPAAAPWQATGRTLRQDYPTEEELNRNLPALILKYNLFGIDIDPRAVQIAELALWMRAQRAFDELGVPRGERACIEKANIVVAEPMPDDPELMESLASQLKVPFLAKLFREIVEEMHLAGDMGSLLKVNENLEHAIDKARQEWERLWTDQIGKKVEQLPLPEMPPKATQAQLELYRGVTNKEFFDDAKTKILAALRRLAEEGNGTSRTRRQLFAKNAGQGFAFIEVVGRTYDVILMNPPFGAGSEKAKAAFDKAYPLTKNDVYAAFVERGIELLEPRGFLGVITSRTGFFLPSFQKWREEILLPKAPPIVFADLGYGVLDGAKVEVAAYCLERVP